MKKPRQVMVGTTDGTFVPLSVVLSNNEVSRRKTEELMGWNWLILKYKKYGRVTQEEVMGVLAGTKRLHAGERDAAGGQIDVTLPFAMLDVIGSTMCGKLEWKHTQVRNKKDAAKQKHLRWIRKADEFRRRHPSWSDLRIAGEIAADPNEWLTDADGKVERPGIRTITRAIGTPKK